MIRRAGDTGHEDFNVGMYSNIKIGNLIYHTINFDQS